MKQKISLLLITLFFVIPMQAFVINFLHDIGVICHVLSEFNAINRRAAYSLVNGNAETASDQEFFGELLPTKRRISINDEPGGFEELAGDLPPEVYEIIEFLQYHSRYAAMGARMPKGVLLVGPPGTGKTSIARAIAQMAHASFFHASGSEFVEVYVGVGPQRVRELFEKARESIQSGHYKSSIIFVDEIDAIGGKRTELENSEYRNTLNELLNQMDGFKQDPSIVVIGATNKPETLDSALKRPGRFDRIVEIGLPNLENRKKILQHYCRRVRLSPFEPLDYDVLGQKTVGLTPAEIKNLVNEAAILAVRRNSEFITMDHFEAVLKNIRKNRR